MDTPNTQENISMTDLHLMALISVIIGVVAIVLISLVAVEDMLFDDLLLPNCTEDEVIVYREFDNSDTLYCLHIDNIHPEITPVASSWVEEPSD